MTRLIAIFLVTGTALASTGASEEAIRAEAVRQLFSDSELVDYTCVSANECTLTSFASRLSIKTVALSKNGAEGIQIEPKKKAKQYFAPIYLRDGGAYRLVFPPDVTFSGVKIVIDNTKLMYPLVAVEHQSSVRWKEYKFEYNAKRAPYLNSSIHCFQVISGKKASAHCN